MIDTGDTAWIMTSSALVLLMTLPGLALFYGGLVRSKNVLSVLMQCLLSAGWVTVVWVLVGYSMGGGIVTNFLYESRLAKQVKGVILEAPMLDFGAVFDRVAGERGVPGILATVSKLIVGFRFDVDWGELNYLKRADELTVPILLFHGDDDPTAPVTTSDALAEKRPDIVTYVRVAGAGHVRSWNTGPAAYEAAVRGCLERVGQ